MNYYAYIIIVIFNSGKLFVIACATSLILREIWFVILLIYKYKYNEYSMLSISLSKIIALLKRYVFSRLHSLILIKCVCNYIVTPDTSLIQLFYNMIYLYINTYKYTYRVINISYYRHFIILTCKIKFMRPSLHLLPSTYLLVKVYRPIKLHNNIIIPIVFDGKYLCLVFDKRLTWFPRLKSKRRLTNYRLLILFKLLSTTLKSINKP